MVIILHYKIFSILTVCEFLINDKNLCTSIMFIVFIATLILIIVVCYVLVHLLSHSKMHVICRLSTLCLLNKLHS